MTVYYSVKSGLIPNHQNYSYSKFLPTAIPHNWLTDKKGRTIRVICSFFAQAVFSNLINLDKMPDYFSSQVFAVSRVSFM